MTSTTRRTTFGTGTALTAEYTAPTVCQELQTEKILYFTIAGGNQ